jgi:hypothetical protein
VEGPPGHLRDLIAPVAERWHPDRARRKPVEKLAAKAAIAQCLNGFAGCGGQDARTSSVAFVEVN